MQDFEVAIAVRWADCDPNNHVRHSAYYDYGAHARIRLFAELGFDTTAMTKLRIGPILFEEKCSFIREIRPEEEIRINVLKGAVREDAARWTLHHEIFGADGEKKAHITIKGAWIDLDKRKLAIPPADLAKSIHALPEGTAYVYKKA